MLGRREDPTAPWRPLPSLAGAGGGAGTVTDPHSCRHLWPPVTAGVAAAGPRPCTGAVLCPEGMVLARSPWECTAGHYSGLGEQGGGREAAMPGGVMAMAGSSALPGLQDLALQGHSGLGRGQSLVDMWVLPLPPPPNTGCSDPTIPARGCASPG